MIRSPKLTRVADFLAQVVILDGYARTASPVHIDSDNVKNPGAFAVDDLSPGPTIEIGFTHNHRFRIFLKIWIHFDRRLNALSPINRPYGVQV